MKVYLFCISGVGEGPSVKSVHSSVELAKEATEQWIKCENSRWEYEHYTFAEEWQADNQGLGYSRALIMTFPPDEFNPKPEIYNDHEWAIIITLELDKLEFLERM